MPTMRFNHDTNDNPANRDAVYCSAPARRRLVSKAEAALYCGVSISAFGSWVRDGKMPQKIPGTRRWDLNAIDNQIDLASGASPKFANSSSSKLDSFSPEECFRQWKIKKMSGEQ
jgi:hypothetical protein